MSTVRKSVLLIVGLMLILGGTLSQAAEVDSRWHRRCQGSGYLSCPYCQGTGNNVSGFDCSHCEGTGKHRCDRCKGSGVLISSIKILKV